ncbi:hypothetical protein SNEBB_004254 [Seison nebaliae]|nr:hypothetical protein SNEBB_004254 [Seison nebaliae]
MTSIRSLIKCQRYVNRNPRNAELLNLIDRHGKLGWQLNKNPKLFGCGDKTDPIIIASTNEGLLEDVMYSKSDRIAAKILGDVFSYRLVRSGFSIIHVNTDDIQLMEKSTRYFNFYNAIEENGIELLKSFHQEEKRAADRAIDEEIGIDYDSNRTVFQHINYSKPFVAIPKKTL